MRIYLDNNATTQIHPQVLDVLSAQLREVFGNASSIHSEGQLARRVLEESRESVAALIGSSPREVVFTSGGTESNNAAIYGITSLSDSRCHLVTTAIEHPSVLEVARDLETRGHSVTYVRPSPEGVVSAQEVIAALRDDTKAVSIMLANNETGTIQPVGEIAAACRSRGIHVHCDAVQAAGKLPLAVNDLCVDTLSLSAHKLHAPKGVGALFVRRGTKLHPHLLGGSQERRRRAGTENVPLAAAFGEAARIAREEPEAVARMQGLRDRLEARMGRTLADVSINGGSVPRIANTSNLLLRGCDAEGIVIALDLQGIAISTGSACSSGRVEPSHVLLAMGLSEEDAKSSIRVSISRFTTDQELQQIAERLEEIVPKIRGRAVAPASR